MDSYLPTYCVYPKSTYYAYLGSDIHNTSISDEAEYILYGEIQPIISLPGLGIELMQVLTLFGQFWKEYSWLKRKQPATPLQSIEK